ncbi:major intracellular serine protease [Podospora aff. communis PSN243]|uniref:Major intracellular serine protease n=1 Tax=Podospora aff. communis PSN243 TaxID=3040156 RepID=A0AAV9H3P2_9PEZI|nr:major intracellular serine protease [Podospora aff. communis PSN243]
MLTTDFRLASGLVFATSLANAVLAASIPPWSRDVRVTPLTSVAVKLNTSGLRARDVRSRVEIVEDLVRRAHPSLKHAKRDAGLNVSPLITSISSEELDEMVQRAVSNDPTYVPTDFNAWYQVHFPEGGTKQDAKELLGNLGGFEEVASVQPLIGATLPALPTVNPDDDPLFKQQGYLGEAGINVKYAWGFPGGDGKGTHVIDVERGWQLEHEDLVARNISLLAGLNVLDRYGGNYPHGTAVLGEMLMVDNKIGGVGIIPGAKGSVVGTHRDRNGGRIENQPEAIVDAARLLKPGDAMVLEMQTGDGVEPTPNLWPVEILDAEFEAIRLAVALGIVVIEPAANGGMNMDEPLIREGDPTPRTFLKKGAPDFRDSGAIMVGSATSGVPHKRHSTSNYGSRVDAYSWGENILTSSVNAAYEDVYLNFSGTSGAAPIVTGAILSVQGMLAANGRKKLTPAEMRKLIVVGGTPSADPKSDKIGLQPNLKALINGGYLKR